jgi:WD40 repeat protein
MTRRLLCLLAVAFVALLSATAGFAATWTTGDIFVGVSSGNYNVYDNGGTFKETINAGSSFTTGCAFNNDQSSLFTTYFGIGNVEKFDTVHPHASSLFVGALSTPESVAFDQAGHVFAGTLGNGIQEYASATNNTLIKTIVPRTRVDWIDIAADQDTIFFTDEGSTIHRASISTGGALPDFTTSPGRWAALRILPDGSVLAAGQSGFVKRFNAAGVEIQSYSNVTDSAWFSLNLDPNGTSFWSADYNTADVVKFNIASGAVEDSFNTGTGAGTVFGLCLKGEITVGGGDTTPPACALIATIPGPPKAIQVEVQDTGSGLATIAHAETNAVTVVPAFVPGTTNPVVITSTKVNQALASSLKVTVTDVAGNTTVCDPVVPGSHTRAHARPHHRLSRFAQLRQARARRQG